LVENILNGRHVSCSGKCGFMRNLDKQPEAAAKGKGKAGKGKGKA
jgi:hypothetical protein